jgi:outer membrane PBP1 activator LpoA protein
MVTRVLRSLLSTAFARVAVPLVLSFPGVVTALSAAPLPATSDVPASPPATVPASSAATPAESAIVLVLPLDSAAYGRAAAAVRSGFLAAADAAKVDAKVISHPDGDPLAGFAKARALGAQVVVGPLLRDDLRALSGADVELPVTIALNQLDDGIPLPERVYVLSLAVEGEGRQLARTVRSRGALTIGIITADNALQRRFASAFVDEWILLGGGPPDTFRFERSPESLTALRKDLGRAALDAVLLAVDGTDVALLKSFVGALPSYTSSQVNDGRTPDVQRDLDDIFFLELPWLVDGAEVGKVARASYGNSTLQRLYALGIDAFRVARLFADGVPEAVEFDGATGHLRLGSARMFGRESQLMRYRAGRVEPAVAR